MGGSSWLLAVADADGGGLVFVAAVAVWAVDGASLTESLVEESPPPWRLAALAVALFDSLWIFFPWSSTTFPVILFRSGDCAGLERIESQLLLLSEDTAEAVLAEEGLLVREIPCSPILRFLSAGSDSERPCKDPCLESVLERGFKTKLPEEGEDPLRSAVATAADMDCKKE